MQIITSPFENRIHQIANMETTPFEIEKAVTQLCFDIAVHTIKQTMEQSQQAVEEALSFENMSKATRVHIDNRSEVL